METKPGYKTTEFWGKVFVQFAILLAMGGVIDVAPEAAEQYGLQIIAGLEATYQGARSLAKFPRGTEVVVGEVPNAS